MISIHDMLKKLETQYDDIIWEEGVNDPRLEDLARQIKKYKKKNVDKD